MANITAEGTLWIELVDVYAWLESRGTATEGAVGIRFSVESDALILEFRGASPVVIEAVEFWTWIIDKQLSRGINHYETVFGVPKVQGPDLVINFATGSETDPRTWGIPPACLAEWRAVGVN